MGGVSADSETQAVPIWSCSRVCCTFVPYHEITCIVHVPNQAASSKKGTLASGETLSDPGYGARDEDRSRLCTTTMRQDSTMYYYN